MYSCTYPSTHVLISHVLMHEQRVMASVGLDAASACDARYTGVVHLVTAGALRERARERF